MIDNWGRKIEKENVKLKATAFEDMTRTSLGLPITVVQGYIRLLTIDVPWSKLTSGPVEITIEDVHIILKSSEGYSRDFVKKSLL